MIVTCEKCGQSFQIEYIEEPFWQSEITHAYEEECPSCHAKMIIRTFI